MRYRVPYPAVCHTPRTNHAAGIQPERGPCGDSVDVSTSSEESEVRGKVSGECDTWCLRPRPRIMRKAQQLHGTYIEHRSLPESPERALQHREYSAPSSHPAKRMHGLLR